MYEFMKQHNTHGLMHHLTYVLSNVGVMGKGRKSVYS